MAHYRIRIYETADSYVDFAYPLLRAYYAENGERIRDRLGNIHRIAAPGTRTPSALTFSVLPQELAVPANASDIEGESGLEWLERMLRTQAELLLFCDGQTVMPDPAGAAATATSGTDSLPLARALAYRCVLDVPPADGFALLPGLEEQRVEVGFNVHETGSFSDYNDIESYETET
jgi:hypothetical protein